jgi:[acyl-carrier-protein] S-malonyltransferase
VSAPYPRIAALFPGQLSEKAGMGEALASEYGYVAELFAAIGLRSGVDIAATYFGDGAPDLHDDLPAQVGVFAVSLGALEVLAAEYDLAPDASAGYSLGTYAAYVAAGALDRWAALEVLLEAERLLREEGAAGRMGYVIGMTRAPLEELLRGISCDPAVLAIGNANATQQFIVTGEPWAVDLAIASAAAVSLRAEVLPSRWAMHSPSLAPVCARLERAVASLDVRAPSTGALLAPMLGRRVDGAAEAARVLAWQIATPSRWEAVVRTLAEQRPTRFAEVGPGDVLAKLLRWTVRTARANVLEDPLSIAAFAAGDGLGSRPRPDDVERA